MTYEPCHAEDARGLPRVLNAFVWTTLAVALVVARPVSAQSSDGRDAYVAYGCYACHGYDGQGSLNGPRIAPDPLPWDGFEQVVRRPPSIMPAYPSEELGAETLRQIYDYLAAIAEPPEAQDIPALSDRLTGEP